ncbi:MAG: protein kinase domain-containing protein [Planctomycetota bacterium]
MANSSNPAATHIRRYRLVGQLGEGGFGSVFLAQDELLNRPVALKLLKRKTGETTDAVRESRLMASMQHPGIAEVYDLGTTDDGRAFIVTRFIDGQPLSRVLSRGAADSAQCARWTLQIALALQHAHTLGITHRDIKPSNIIITSSGDAVVLDFGVALCDSDKRTPGDYSGTPAWMSPEQAAGRTHEIDGRSDIFSLGCVLYEMLTGVQPFRGSTKVEMLGQIQTAEPRPVRQLQPHRPPELEAICLRCLQKRREDRFSNAGDLISSLETFIKGWSTQTPRLPLSTKSAALLATLVLISTVYWLWQRSTPTPNLSSPSTSSATASQPSPSDISASLRAILNRRAVADERLLAGILESSETAETPRNGPLPSAETSSTDLPPLPAGFEELEKQLLDAVAKNDRDAEFSLLLRASNELSDARHLSVAESLTRRMVKLADGDPGGYPIACGQYGMILYKRGKLEEAVSFLGRANDAYQSLYDKVAAVNSPQTATHLSHLARLLGITWTRVGNAYKFAGRYDEAGEAYRKAMQLCEKHDRDSELLTVLLNFGSMESMRENHLTAKTLLTQGLDVADRLKESVARAEIELNLANALSRAGDHDGALKAYENVDAASKDSDSTELRSKLLMNFAFELLEQGRKTDAREKLRELKLIARPGDTDALDAVRLMNQLDQNP